MEWFGVRAGRWLEEGQGEGCGFWRGTVALGREGKSKNQLTQKEGKGHTPADPKGVGR